jgi:DNA (cytosine-5)-methyltransferase 1
MNVLDLFSGIGGFSLGLERAGMRTVGFCEIDPFCRRVLRKHWPTIPVYDDVRTLTGELLSGSATLGCASVRSSASRFRGRAGIDIICGGFPCQDISVAGKGAGIGGERSGLWSQFARIVGEVRPRYVIVENVAALLGRGLSVVLGNLATLGYDAEWHCIPASAVGAPHQRDRVWIMANAQHSELRDKPRRGNGASGASASEPRYDGSQGGVADADEPRLAQRQEHQLLGQCETLVGSDWWLVEPDVGRVAHGISARVDRLRSLGNAIVPQIAEIIGRAIMKGQDDGQCPAVGNALLPVPQAGVGAQDQGD